MLMLRFPCFVFPPLSAPHPVVLSPQSLYPSDSRQCVLHPPTWHSAQGPQGVCVYVFHCVAFLCTLCTGVAPHMLVFNYLFFSACDLKWLACACCLSVSFCVSACLQALLLGLLLHYFGRSELQLWFPVGPSRQSTILWERESEWVSEWVSMKEKESERE